jgi:hypothetical protein
MKEKASQPRQETIHKYTIFLKSALVRIRKEGEQFSATNFTKSNRLPSKFIQECVNLGFIDKTGTVRNSRYFPILDFGTVCEAHGRALAENLLKYNYSHRNEYGMPTIEGVKKDVKIFDRTMSDLSDYSLIQELKCRGYKGDLRKQITEIVTL